MSLAKLLGQKIKEKVEDATAGKHKQMMKDSMENRSVP